jgi:hypothetical protein
MEIRILKRLSYKYCNVEIELNGVTKEGYSKAVELVDYAIDSEFQKLKAYVDEHGEKVELKPAYQPKQQYNNNNYQKPQYPAKAPNTTPPSEAQIGLLRKLKVSEEQIASITTSTEASALIQQVKGGATPQPQPQYQAPTQAPVQQQAQQVQAIKTKANPFDM